MWRTRYRIDSLCWLLLAAWAQPASAGSVEPARLAESLWQRNAEPALGDGFRSCAGAYVEPLAAGTGGPNPPVDLTAQTLRSRIGGITHVDGGVVVRQGDRTLASMALEIDEHAAIARATSTARLAQPGLHMIGTRAIVGLGDDSARIDDAEFVLTGLELRGKAAHIDRAASVLRFASTSLTRCPPARNTWRLQASAVEIEQDAVFATARHARLMLGKMPIFYSPYLRFPVRSGRASGFLFPNTGYDDEDGVDIALPYYLNLAPHYDATLTARYIANRGTGLEGEFRHLGPRTRTAIGSAFLGSDRNYDGELPRADFLAGGGAAQDFAPAHRWLARANHRGRHGRLRTLVDYTAVSDNDYFVDLGAELAIASRIRLEQRSEIRYTHGGLFTRLWAQSFQRLEPGLAPYRRLPEANLTYAGTVHGPLDWTVDASWSAFRRGSSAGATGLAAVVGNRIHLEPRLRLPLARPWGFLTLSAGLRQTAYDLAKTPAHIDRTPQRSIGMASADGGLFLERAVYGGAWTQTLEPRLYYLYQSYAAQQQLPRFDAARLTFGYRQLFRDNRFAGLDRIGDANQLAMGVTTRVLNAASGRELLAASIGVIGYLEDRRVVLSGRPTDYQAQPTSTLASELRSTLGRARIAATLAWNPHDDTLEEAGLAVSYRHGAGRLLNLGYRRRTVDDIDQTDLSFHWPLTRQWSTFGRWNHDWRFGQTIEAFAGVGFASCCLDLKVLWHRTVDVPRNRLRPGLTKDSGVLLQLVFRGLAGFGTKVDSRLARGIKGFTRTEHR